MSALTPYASTALGAGVACLSLGATRRIDTGWKAFGLALCALAFSAAPAHADQYVEAADNAKIDCTLSRGDLTRIALIDDGFANRSEEHTSELQSLMRISYAVFCLKKKIINITYP